MFFYIFTIFLFLPKQNAPFFEHFYLVLPPLLSARLEKRSISDLAFRCKQKHSTNYSFAEVMPVLVHRESIAVTLVDQAIALPPIVVRDGGLVVIWQLLLPLRHVGAHSWHRMWIYTKLVILSKNETSKDHPSKSQLASKYLFSLLTSIIVKSNVPQQTVIEK